MLAAPVAREQALCQSGGGLSAVASEVHVELHGGSKAGLACAPWARAGAARGGPQCCALRIPAARPGPKFILFFMQAACDAAGDGRHPAPGACAPGASPPGCQRSLTSCPPALASNSTTQDGRRRAAGQTPCMRAAHAGLRVAAARGQRALVAAHCSPCMLHQRAQAQTGRPRAADRLCCRCACRADRLRYLIGARAGPD